MTISTIIMIICVVIFGVIPTFKDRVISVRKLLITPIIFVYLFYQTIVENFSIAHTDLVLICFGAIVGISLGYWLRRNVMVKSNVEHKLIFIPGSYAALFIFSAMFGIHFIIGYLQAVSPEIFLDKSSVEQMLLFLLTCASCLTIGVSSCLYYKYLKAENKLSV